MTTHLKSFSYCACNVASNIDLPYRTNLKLYCREHAFVFGAQTEHLSHRELCSREHASVVRIDLSAMYVTDWQAS